MKRICLLGKDWINDRAVDGTVQGLDWGDSGQTPPPVSGERGEDPSEHGCKRCLILPLGIHVPQNFRCGIVPQPISFIQKLRKLPNFV